MKQRVSFSRHTRESVQSPLVVLKLKVRKGGDFFYGKSSNENHIESVRSSVSRCVRKENHRNCKEKWITGERTGTTSY